MLRYVLATTLTLLPAAAFAAETPKKDSRSRTVCRTIDESGSRTRSARVCKPQAEWEAAENRAKQEAMELERGTTTPSEPREPR